MSRIAGLGLLVAALTVIGGQSTAHADGPYCGGYGLGGWGMNFPYGLYGSRVNDVPYFAMFPPVYYSHPVPRTYGWSPFAYPPGTMTPEVVVQQPQDITNPFVPLPKSDAQPSSAQTTDRMASKRPAPQVIVNPYVKSATVVARASK